jgi:hypothetical protein
MPTNREMIFVLLFSMLAIGNSAGYKGDIANPSVTRIPVFFCGVGKF